VAAAPKKAAKPRTAKAQPAEDAAAAKPAKPKSKPKTAKSQADDAGEPAAEKPAGAGQ
jgi:hypothetical protein